MTSRPHVDGALASRLLAVSAIAAAVAVGAGLVVGSATYAVMMGGASESDGWAELGAAIFGALLGLAAGCIAYVAVAIISVRRVQEAGRRLRPALAVLLLPAGLALPTTITGAVMGRRAPEALAAGAALLLLAAAGVGLAALAGVVGAKPGTIVAVPATALAVALLVATAMIGDVAERDEKLDAIERIGALPLVDGARLGEPFPGWTLDAVRHRAHDDSIDVHWDVEDADRPGDAHLTITANDVEVRVHAGDDWRALEDQLRSRLVRVPAERFIEACGRRC